MNRTLLILFIACLTASAATAAPGDFPRPSALEPDITFWTRIYGEVASDSGLLHDTRDLGLVYEVVKIPAGLSRRARERHTEKRKKRYKTMLLRLAKGKRSGLSRDETRVLALFDAKVTNGTLRSAARRIRFQLGQADKFRAGVIRSGAYKPHILKVLRNMGLPSEIAHLPHVESSYTPTIYSRVGAAGLWQFTRSTGRRFMQVDHVVDERLDPYHASVAAARLLEQNRRVTGTWPLAITAYNHGASGIRRASRKLGTKDIVRIVRKYHSRSFGFASRNFYVEFLAADTVASDPEFYFGPLLLDRPIAYETIEMPYYAKSNHLAQAIGIDIGTLKEANPALRATVWNQAKYIPKGFELRVPRASLPRPLSNGVAALPQAQRHARQTRDTKYTVRRGDTLSTIARRHRVRMSELIALNGLKSKHRIRVGQKLRLPSQGSSSRRVAYNSKSKSTEKSNTAPRASAESQLPATLPKDGYYTVARGDNLTQIAQRFGLSVSELVSLNRLRSQNRIAVGQKLLISPANTLAEIAKAERPHPDATATLTPARSAEAQPGATDIAIMESTEEPTATPDESAVEPSPGLLADPSDYSVATNGAIIVQANETLGHYAEWLGLRTSRLRQINGLRYGEPVALQQKLQLDFSQIRPEDFERVRVEYHRVLQEEFFAAWEISGTTVHRVSSGDSLWILSTRRFDVPVWLLRQYNPDVDLKALSMGTELTIPKLRQRGADTSETRVTARGAAAG